MSSAHQAVARTVYPSEFHAALVNAAAWPDPLKRIDSLTDEMVARGLLRPRHDMSRHGEWLQTRRPASAVKGAAL